MNKKRGKVFYQFFLIMAIILFCASFISASFFSDFFSKFGKTTGNIISEENLDNYYKLNGNSNDDAGSYDGTAVGGVSWNSNSIEGQSAEFDGDVSYIEFSDMGGHTEGFTISVWVYPKSAELDSSDGNVYEFDDGLLYYDYNNNQLVFFGWKGRTGFDGYQYNYVCEADAQLNEWTNFVVSATGTSGDNAQQWKCYKNGNFVENAEYKHTGMSIYYNYERIGARRHNYGEHAPSITGLVDELRIYNNVLTEDQISNLYTEFDSSEDSSEEQTIEEVNCRPRQLIGDANNDGIINLTDANLVMNIYLGDIAEPENIFCIDMNNDGSITPADSTLISEIANGNSESNGDRGALFVLDPTDGTVKPEIRIFFPSSQVGEGKFYYDAKSVLENTEIDQIWKFNKEGGFDLYEEESQDSENFLINKTEPYFVNIINGENKYNLFLKGSQKIDSLNFKHVDDITNSHQFVIPENWIGKKASELYEDIPNCDQVSYFDYDEQFYHSYSKYIPSTDFVLKEGRVVHIGISKDTSWNKEFSNNLICDDSDGGLNIYKKGHLEDLEHGNAVYDDTCTNLKTTDISEGWTPTQQGEILIEYYCGNKNYQYTAIECVNGCENGACVEEETITEVTCVTGQLEGDANNDGIIGLTDANLVMNIYLGDIAEPENIFCIDMNNDGSITPADSTLISEIANGNSEDQSSSEEDEESSDDQNADNCANGCLTSEGECLQYGTRILGKEIGKSSPKDEIGFYCSIKGNFQEQKELKDLEGNEASCQNNYECKSNFCSDGKCTKLADKNFIQDFFIRIICRISHPLNSDNYQDCVNEKFGEDESENDLFCEESKEGKDYSEKEWVKFKTLSSGVSTVYDGCIESNSDNDGFLREVYCDGSNMVFEDYDCSKEGKICKDGACVEEIS